MLAYFPKPYPDEAFYSLVARYQKHTLCSAYQALANELFGVNHIEPSIDLPGRISVFLTRANSVLSLTDVELVNLHTLWPYFGHFIKSSFHESVIASLKKKHDPQFDLKFGIRSANIKRVKIPMYCPKCCLNDMNRQGEMYWRRTHQIPSILVCTKHNCYLQQAHLGELASTKQFQFIYASRETCPQIIPVKNTKNVVLELANRMAELLDSSKSLENKFKENLQVLKRIYSKSSQLQFKKLKTEFYDYYGKETIALYQKSQKWTDRKLLTIDPIRRETIINPLRNLMIEKFIEEKSKNSITHQPNFKIESIPCENFIIHGNEKTLVPITAVKYSKRKQCLCGYFICHCGMKLCVYKFGNQNYSKPIIDDRGLSWKNELKKMLKSGASKDAISAKFKIALHLVNHYRVLFENELSKEEIKRCADADNKFRLKKYRTNWLNSFNRHPKWNISRIGKNIPYTYIWLLKNDNDWITKINSAHRFNVKKPSQPKFNYPELDKSFLKKIKEVHQTLVSKCYKQRITSTLLKRSLQTGIKKITSAKFPLTTELLQKVSEDLKKRDKRLSTIVSN